MRIMLTDFQHTDMTVIQKWLQFSACSVICKKYQPEMI